MKKIIFPLLVIVLSLFAVLPLFNQDFFTVHDNTQVTRVFEMGNALSDGAFPVRWVENLGYGYGYPIFNFYAPLPYYIGGTVALLSANALLGTKIMFGVGILLSGVTMFYTTRRFFGDAAGLVAGVIYMYFPYHALNIYVRGAVGEFFAYAFLPIVFMGAFMLFEKAQKKTNIRELFYPAVTLSIGIALVGISHNLTLFMTTVLLGVFFLIAVCFTKAKKLFVLSFIAAFLFGVLLSAFYVIPSFTEMNYTNVNSVVGGGSDYPDHFVCVSQLWEGVWGYGGSTSGCLDGISFKLGKTNTLFVALSLFVFAYLLLIKKKSFALSLFGISFALLALSVFLVLPYSQFVWDSVPFMEYLQFPWRFSNFIALFSSFVIAFEIYGVSQFTKERYVYTVSAIVIGATLLLNAKLFTPQGFNTNYVNETNPSYIRYTVSKISDEYLPNNFSRPESASKVPTVVYSFEGKNISSLIEKNSRNIVISYNIPESQRIFVNLAYFPSWSVAINGNKIDYMNANPGITFEVPRGEGEIEIKNEGTMVENTANAISLIAILGLIAGIIVVHKKVKK